MKAWQKRRVLAQGGQADHVTTLALVAAPAAPTLVAVNPSTLRSRRRRAAMTPNERTRLWAKYAHKRRLDLVKLLSPDGRCSGCGEIFDHASLTIQHAGSDGCSFEHRGRINRGLNQRARASAYWREHEAGVPLEAMCSPCNGRDSRRLWGKRRRRGARRLAA